MAEAVVFDQYNPLDGVSDLVGEVIEAQNEKGFKLIQAGLPEVDQLDIGLQVATFGSAPSEDRLHVVAFSPYGNDLSEPHRLVLYNVYYDMLKIVCNGYEEFTLSVVSAPAGDHSPYQPRESTPNDVAEKGIGVYGREIMRSLDRYYVSRGARHLGKVGYFGASLAAATSIATAADPEARTDFEPVAVGAIADPRTRDRSVPWLQATFGLAPVEKQPARSPIVHEPQTEALKKMSGNVTFVRNILKQAKINNALATALSNQTFGDDLRALLDPTNGEVPAMLVGSGTDDRISRFKHLASEVERIVMSLRDVAETDQLQIVEIVRGKHLLVEDPPSIAEMFKRAIIDPLIK